MRNWRKTKEYKAWKACVTEGKVCYVCKATRRLHSHHINHASYFPEQRFDVKNGVTLCSKCHSNYHNNYHRSTRVKCTKYDFYNFISLVKYLQEAV